MPLICFDCGVCLGCWAAECRPQLYAPHTSWVSSHLFTPLLAMVAVQPPTYGLSCLGGKTRTHTHMRAPVSSLLVPFSQPPPTLILFIFYTGK